MIPDILLLAAASISLILAACWAWGDVLEREAMDAQLAADRLADRMDAAATDEMLCDVCHESSRVRELVALYDDAALCCIPCAETIKVRRGRQERAA